MKCGILYGMRVSKKRQPSRQGRRIVRSYFFPGLHNAHRPAFLEFQAIVINVAIAALLFLIAHGVQRLVFTTPSEQVGSVIAAVLVDLTNEDRSTEGLSALSTSETLQKAAQMKADDMASKEYFAHRSPEGVDPWHWFKEAEYDFRFAGENLAVYFSDSEEVEKAWMNSPTHRANIMSSNFSEIGIALAHGRYQGHDTAFVVQMFGSPLGKTASAVISSEPAPIGGVAGASAEKLETILEDDTFIAVKREGETLAAVTNTPRPVGAIKASAPNPFLRVLASPKTTLEFIYMVLAGIVLLLLIFMLLRGSRTMHLPSVARGVGLLVVIGALFWTSTYISGTLLIL